MRLTTVIIFMGITLPIATHLVIRTTGVGTHIGGEVILMPTRTTAIILRIGTLMTIAPYQGIDSFIPDHVKFLIPTGPSWVSLHVDSQGEQSRLLTPLPATGSVSMARG
jgi:hypothetical protein